MPFSGMLDPETVTVAGTAIGIDGTAGAAGVKVNAAFITVEGAAIRWWANGSTPTATSGHSAEPGDSISLVERDQVVKFLAIRRDGVSATLFVSPARSYVP